MLESDLQTDRFVSAVFYFIVRNIMNVLRKAFGRVCVLHTHLSQAVSPKLSCYRVIGTNVWTRGFAAVSSASTKDIRERKTVQVIWDKDMDERLAAGIDKFTSKDWNSVVDHMGQGLTAMQCKRRWYLHLRSKRDNQVVDRTWTESEVTQLHERINEYLKTPGKKIKWTLIAKEMNRTVAQCRFKWERTQYKLMGAFTVQEDAHIRHAVDAAGGTVKGIWRKLAGELGRQANLVRSRYLVLKSGAQSKAPWTGEMDPCLVEARGKGKKPDWAQVAAQMAEKGWNVTSSGCKSRWNNHLKHVHGGLRVEVEWTQAEVDVLVAMRKELQNWGTIAKTLNIVPKLCKSKYASVSLVSLKRGPFTPEEDAIIISRVEAWGDPKQRLGLWMELQELLKRPSASVRHRWFYKLYHQQENMY